MAGRILTLTPGFARARSRLRIQTGTDRAKALAACVGSIGSSDALPGPTDCEADFPPGTAYVRRAGRANLWVWYRFGADHITILTVTDTPPIPRGE